MKLSMFLIFIIYLTRIILKIFYLFPVKNNKFFFISYNGRQYACNPKYIFEYIYQYYGNKYTYIYCLNDKMNFPSVFTGVTVVKPKSINCIYHLMTSKFIITNSGLSSYLSFRKQQIVVETWHGGGAYKRVGIKHGNNIKQLSIILKLVERNMTYFISSSKCFSKNMSESYFFNIDKVLSIGMPRNDIFFSSYEVIICQVKKHFNIPENYGVLLYAPTFRVSVKNVVPFADLDVIKTLTVLSKRFHKQFVCLFRKHHLINDSFISESIINASLYPDMQELLCAADVLITDYSSSIWDFSFMNKPCFLYAPDLDNYKKERDFYIPIEKWPFPLACSITELEKNILAFDDEKYKKDIKKHHVELGSFEKGDATKSLLEIILNK